MKKRKQEIAALNVLFCLLVVFIHVASEQITVLDKSAPAYFLLFIPWRLSAFVMQGFILLSGVKFILKFEGGRFNYLQFIKNRFIKIYVPYIIFTVIYYLYFCYLNFYSFDLSELFNFLLIGNVVSPFYFIVVIMQFYLLMPVWIFLLKKTDAVFLILASVFIMLIMKSINIKYNDRIFTTYIAYWVIGCCIGANYGRFIELFEKNTLFLTVTLILTAVLDALFSCLNVLGNGPFPFLETLHIFYCLTAIIFLFCISLRFKNKNVLLLINKLDGLSFGIFLSHCLFIYMINDIMQRIGIAKSLYRFTIRVVFVYLITIALCGTYAFLKKKHKG